MSNIIYRGTLTLQKLKELSDIHLGQRKEYEDAIGAMESQPLTKTQNKYTITQMADGNYVGETIKNGKLIKVRQGDPVTVLTLLITHE